MTTLHFPHDIEYLKGLESDAKSCEVSRKDHVFSLGIGLTTRCNFRCPMCYYHTDTQNMLKHVDMPLDLLKSILEDMPILSNIIVGLEGEPFCYPDIFSALDS